MTTTMTAKATHPWKTIALASLAACSLTPLARSDILAEEGFGSHISGTNVAGSGDGSGWSANWDGDGNFDYQSSPVNFAASPFVYSPSGGSYASNPAGHSGRVGRFLDTSAGGTFDLAGYLNGSGNIGADGTTLYIGWAMALNPNDDYYAFAIYRDGTGDGERQLEVGTDGPNASEANLQLRPHGNNGATQLIATNAEVGTGVNYFVLRIDFLAGDDAVSIFMNPTLNAEEGTPMVSIFGSDAGDLSFDRIAIASFGVNPPLSMDDIRIGTTYADVVGAVPEPSTSALIGLSLGTMLFFRKRRVA